MKEVYYSKYYSTSMLIIWHMKKHLKDIYKHHLEAKMEEKNLQRRVKEMLSDL